MSVINQINFAKNIADSLRTAFGPPPQISEDDIARSVAYHLHLGNFPSPDIVPLNEQIKNFICFLLSTLFNNSEEEAKWLATHNHDNIYDLVLDKYEKLNREKF